MSKKGKLRVPVISPVPRFGVMPSMPQRDRKKHPKRQPKHKGRAE